MTTSFYPVDATPLPRRFFILRLVLGLGLALVLALGPQRLWL